MNTRISDNIRAACGAAIKHIGEQDDSLAQAVIGRQAEYRLILNSSFISRDKRSLRTTQSPRRLIAQLVGRGRQVGVRDIGVIDNRAIRDNYKLLGPQDAAGCESLLDAVTEEIRSAGDLLFVLVGTLKGLRPASRMVNANVVKELRIDPSQRASSQKLGNGIYCIATLLPMEDLLSFIEHDVGGPQALPAAERIKISEAYDRLLDEATADVVIPDARIRESETTILGKIVGAIRSQSRDYRVALRDLEESPTDRHALHEVLRVAYNFSSDVVPLLFLFISVCDLKPLVFWLTLDAQWEFRAALGSLPWLALGRKEKLEEYQSIISRARDHAFHHILPFDATLEIDLSGSDVRADRIRLFSPYGTNEGRGIHMKDQALADVFAEFSRSRQRAVSLSFWRANLRFMDSVCELATRILDAIVLIHEARRSG